jgi:hypothetical protein
MHLFNDNASKHGHLIYMKRKRKGEDSKIAVRQRDRVCVRDGAWQREEVELVVKRAIGET